MAKPKKPARKVAETLPLDDPQAILTDAPVEVEVEIDDDVSAAIDEATSEDPIPAEARAAFQEPQEPQEPQDDGRRTVWYATVYASTLHLAHVDHFAELPDKPERPVGPWVQKFKDGSSAKMFTVRALTRVLAVHGAVHPENRLDSAASHG